jgi:hypothetical protein
MYMSPSRPLFAPTLTAKIHPPQLTSSPQKTTNRLYQFLTPLLHKTTEQTFRRSSAEIMSYNLSDEFKTYCLFKLYEKCAHCITQDNFSAEFEAVLRAKMAPIEKGDTLEDLVTAAPKIAIPLKEALIKKVVDSGALVEKSSGQKQDFAEREFISHITELSE